MQRQILNIFLQKNSNLSLDKMPQILYITKYFFQQK